MASDVTSKIYRAGQVATGNTLESIMHKFHRDFMHQSNKMLAYMKEANTDRIDQKKKKLSQVFGPTTSSVTTSNKTTYINGKTSSESITIQKAMLKELSSIGNILVKHGEKNERTQKIHYTRQSVFARLISDSIEKVTGIAFKGPTEQERLVNAVENVERAIRGQASKGLDERTGIRKLLESNLGHHMPGSKKLLQAMDFVNSLEVGVLKDIILNGAVAAKTLHGKAKGILSSAKDKLPDYDVKKVAGLIMGKFTNALDSAHIDISPATKEKMKNFIGGAVGTLMDKVSSINLSPRSIAKYLTRKAITGSTTLFYGSLSSWFMTQLVTHPFKTAKWAGRGYRASKFVGHWTGVMMDSVRTYITDPIRQIIGRPRKILGKTRGAASMSSKMIGGFLDAWLESGVMESARKIGSIAGPLVGVISIPFLAIAKFMHTDPLKVVADSIKYFFKKNIFGQNMFMKDMKNVISATWKKLGKAATAMIEGFGKIVALAIDSLPFLIGGLIVGGILGIAYMIYEYWPEIKEAFNKYIVDPIKDTFNSIVDGIKNIFNGLSGIVEKAIRAVPWVGNKLADSIFGNGVSAVNETPNINGKVVDGTTMMNNNGKVDKLMPNMQSMDTNGLQDMMQKFTDHLDKQQEQMKKPTVVVAPSAPAHNIDDIGTYLVTQ